MTDQKSSVLQGHAAFPKLEATSSASAPRGDDGLQVVPHEYWQGENADPQARLPEGGKQVAYGSDEKQTYASDEKQRDEKQSANDIDTPDKYLADESPKRRKRLWTWVAVVVVAAILIAIAIVIPVVVTRKNNASSGPSPAAAAPSPSTTVTSIIPGSTASGSPQVANYLSTSGTFNGTGIATMNPQNGVDYFWLFYQAYDGDLRYIPLSTTGAWQSSKSLGIKDRANATALKAFSYQPKNSLVYHLFYVDGSGILQDLIYTNQTQSWSAGTLGAQKWKTPSGRSVSLSADWDPKIYGKVTTAGPNLGGGLRLWAGGEDGLLHEYAHDYNSDSWDAGFTFPGTNAWGGASPERAGNLVTQHLVSSNNQLELWWRNCNDGKCYPSGQWNKGVDASSSLYPNTSVTTCAAGKGAYYLNSNGTVVVTPWSGTQATERWNQTLSLGIQAMPGSTLACGTLSGGSGASVHLYLQTNGSDLSEWVPDNTGLFYSRVADVPIR